MTVWGWTLAALAAFAVVALAGWMASDAKASIPPRGPSPRVCGVIPTPDMGDYLDGLIMVWSVGTSGCLKLTSAMPKVRAR